MKLLVHHLDRFWAEPSEAETDTTTDTTQSGLGVNPPEGGCQSRPEQLPDAQLGYGLIQDEIWLLFSVEFSY